MVDGLCSIRSHRRPGVGLTTTGVITPGITLGKMIALAVVVELDDDEAGGMISTLLTGIWIAGVTQVPQEH